MQCQKNGTEAERRPFSLILIFFHSASQLLKQTRQVFGLVMSVEAARVRQDPEARIIHPLSLKTQPRFRTSERASIRSDSEHSDVTRAVTLHLRRKQPSARDKLLRRQFIRRRGRARDHVRNPVSALEQFALLRGRKQSFGESGGVERGPEPVARTREVVARDGSV